MPSRNAIPPEFQTILDHGDPDALEGEWLRRVGRRGTAVAGEVEGLCAVAHALASGEDGDPDQARFLLELLDEQLRAKELWQARLDLLRRAGELLLGEGADVHAEIMQVLEARYGDRSIFSGMAEVVGLHRAIHDLPKVWDKVERFQTMMAYDVGTIVAMEGRGVGTIADVNFQLEKLKVDFAHHAALNVGFRAAPKMLEPLPPEHILRRKVEDPATLKALRDDDPADLLRIVLESRGTERTAAEIRADLAGVVPDSKWTSFWNAARKHPQVVVHGKGRQSYGWAASSDHALETVWNAFEAAPPRKQIDLLRREGERDAELGRRMAEALATLGREVADDDPGLAFELWAALEREGAAPPEDAPFAPTALLEESTERARTVLSGIEDRTFRERAYREVRRRRDDWRHIFLERLKREEDPRALDLMYGEVAADTEAGGGEGKELARFLDGLLAQPHRSPAAFVWMAEHAAGDLAVLRRNPLRLLQQLFTAMGRDEFTPYRQRLKNLMAKGATASKIFPELEEDQAAAAAVAIHRAGYLEEYEREELERALHLSFPSLKGDSAKPDVLWATEASIAERRQQLEDITRKELPANRKAIEEARAMGDLRENFEYKSARQRHEYLTALASKLQAELAKAKPLDLSVIDPSQVRVGTRVVLAAEDGGERTLTILGPWESAPEKGVISYESELAEKLLGKGVGDSVETAEGRSEAVKAVEVAQL